MKTLVKIIRQAEAAPALTENDQDTTVRESIESLGDSEDVQAFVSALTEYDVKRASLYVAHVKSFFPALWTDLKKAEEEETEDEPATAEGEQPTPPTTVDTSIPTPEDQAPAAEGEEVSVPVVDPEQLDEAQASIDMVLFNKDSKDPHWSVFANGMPMAEIHLADQENPEDVRETFTSDEYENHVTEACASSIGVKEMMKALKARFYHAVTRTASVHTEARTAATKQLESEYAVRLAALKEDLLNTINLAVVASLKGSKGLFVNNTLKAAMVDAMRRAGVKNALPLVNEAFAKHGQEYFSAVLKHAEKWLGYTPEALAELSTEILGPVSAEAEPDAPEPAPLIEDNEDIDQMDMPKPPVTMASKRPMNVPLRTVTTPRHAAAGDDFTQRVASALSRRMGKQRAGLR